MDRVDAYRQFAAQCVELAGQMGTTTDRTILLEMVLLWSRLAELAAKNTVAKEPQKNGIVG